MADTSVVGSVYKPRPLWPPRCVETSVKWLRDHPRLSVFAVIVAIGIIIGLYAGLPPDTGVISGSTLLGVTVLLSVFSIVEIIRQRKKEAQAPQHKDLIKRFWQFMEPKCKAHLQQMVSLVGGSEAYKKLPEIEAKKFNYRMLSEYFDEVTSKEASGELTFIPEAVSDPLMRGSLKLDFDVAYQLNILVVKFRNKHTGEIFAATIYQKNLFDFNEDARFVIVCSGKGALSRQDAFSHSIITQDSSIEPKPVLSNTGSTLKAIIDGSHDTFELVKKKVSPIR